MARHNSSNPPCPTHQKSSTSFNFLSSRPTSTNSTKNKNPWQSSTSSNSKSSTFCILTMTQKARWTFQAPPLVPKVNYLSIYGTARSKGCSRLRWSVIRRILRLRFSWMSEDTSWTSPLTSLTTFYSSSTTTRTSWLIRKCHPNRHLSCASTCLPKIA